MMHRITLIPGDGIGPEITKATLEVVEATGLKVEWEIFEAGTCAIEKYKNPLPDEVINSIRRNGVCLKGPTTTPIAEGFRSINVALRKELDLFANVRPAKSLEGINSHYKNVDIVVIRENTEDLYCGVEHRIGDFAAESIKIITAKASTRIAKFAFEYAKREGRKKVTAVHKANIMKLTDGLFLECVRNVSKEYPDIIYEEIIVDNMCMQLVRNPEIYDVILCPNLYGDIISDLCAGLVGGLGVVPGANIGDNLAVFEAVHGSAPDIAGKNIANPTALILSAAQMLKYIGESERGRKIEKALEIVIKEKLCLTPDLGGNATTEEFSIKICEKIKEL
ncbi:isocitrate/isopropylmalate dehydrogenase family protein [Thermovenabulum sp.]|uniref:isocitrate/isopropylmalate dehydrogenase family protein n=1 Tax=Thermovenabulum sp. TaxID=3100335 RepID=UPI003C7A3C70